MGTKKVNKEFLTDFAKLVEQTLVPRFSNDTVRPCAEEDFQEYRKILMRNLHSIESTLDAFVQNENQWTNETKANLLKVLIVIGEQHSKNPWNTDEIVMFSHKLIPKICKIFDTVNLTQILKDENIFISAIMFLRAKLMKDTWKSFPAAVVCYKWLLELVERPLLKRHVSEVLPTALIILDDYVQENQKLGLECINVIVQHCLQSRALKNLNYDQVVFQALERMAHKAEPSMIIPLYSCISNLLESMEYCEDSSNSFRWSKRDEISIILLSNMELQSNPQARHAYVSSLKKVVARGKFAVWSERISMILAEYCEENTDVQVTNASLDFLEFFLAKYQPKGQNFYITMYVSLLKLRYSLHWLTEEKLTEKVLHCINLLNELCPSMSEAVMSNSRIAAAMVPV
ncbi:uncharacterized protein LOC100216454 [Nasonia vitripennis]|uniref:Uncharacterized protein n=1 Tax=Nasonia vitripennis TaxID=7425 RepID=A0A7M6UVI8_NASVI|nr:uncharacterized protein LOC100216454 [Nasonia vitripennis]